MLVALEAGSWLPTSTHSVRCVACTALAKVISAGQTSADWFIAAKRPVRACHYVTGATYIAECMPEQVDISMIWSARVLSQGGRARWSCGAVRHAQAHLAGRRQITNNSAWSFSTSVSFVNCRLSLWRGARYVPKIVELAILAQPNSRVRSHGPSEALPHCPPLSASTDQSAIFDSPSNPPSPLLRLLQRAALREAHSILIHKRSSQVRAVHGHRQCEG